MRRTLTYLIGLALILWFCWWSLGIAFAQTECGAEACVGTAVTQGYDADGCLVTETDGTVTERVCPAYPLNPPDGPVQAQPSATG